MPRIELRLAICPLRKISLVPLEALLGEISVADLLSGLTVEIGGNYKVEVTLQSVDLDFSPVLDLLVPKWLSCTASLSLFYLTTKSGFNKDLKTSIASSSGLSCSSEERENRTKRYYYTRE